MTEHHQPTPNEIPRPTEEMIVAGMEASVAGRPSVDDDSYVLSIWDAMCAAAPVEQEPVHQYRVRYRTDWYDGHPDTRDGKDYETRTLYAAPVAARAQPTIKESLTVEQPVSGDDGLPESPTRGMNLGQRIAHVGGRENAQGYVEFGSPMAVDALIQHILRDMTTSTQEGAFQARYRIPGGPWSSWGAVTCGVKGHEQELRYLATEAQPQPSGNAGQLDDGALPPLPNHSMETMHNGEDRFWFTEAQMEDYARAALAAQAGGQTQLGYTLSDVHEAYSRGKAEGQTSGEDREDAERYRHLRDHSDLAPHDVFNADWLAEHGNPETLDAAIDASRRES